MFCCKSAQSLIDKTHFRALKARYSNFSESFDSLLARSKSVKIHHRNINLMVIEVFKSLNQIGPKILHDIFMQRHIDYELRSGDSLQIPNFRNINSFDFRASMTWNELPVVIKNAGSLNEFKQRLSRFRLSCKCTNCRWYAAHPKLIFNFWFFIY